MNSPALVLAIALAFGFHTSQALAQTKPLPAHHGKVATQFYLTPDGAALPAGSPKRPLLVAMGGAEGGNPWAGPRAQTMRNLFLADGYAFLALGYFGAPGTPEKLDRIAIDAVRDAILKAAQDPAVDARCIALIGGSKGAELALLMASRYPDIKAVAAVVPGSAVFVGHTDQFDTGSFSENGVELPYVPMTEKAVPALLAGDKRKVFDLMMEDKAAVARARIPVEKINGPVFFLSATQDELWASKEMSDQMMETLKQAKFGHAFEHVAIEGGHGAPMRHLNLVRKFLNEKFRPQVKDGCGR
jgi:pimeloyl-ACP methyl ester carboxylesterase